MSLQVTVVKPKHIKAKEALLVKFPYDLESIAKIKSLPVRYYIASERAWEVPSKELETLAKMFPDAKLKVEGKVSKKKMDKLDKLVTFEKVDTSGFQFKTQPFQHQIEAFDYAQAHQKFLLADDPGLGKTKQAIDIAMSRKDQFKHCLIVCGINSLTRNWLAEVKVHSNESGRILGSRIDKKGKLKVGSVAERIDDLNRDLSEFFLITNIETMRSKEFASKIEELTENGTIGMVVIDEVHMCKNSSSTQGKAIHKLKSFYRIAATGTPIMNKALDLYNVLKWIEAERGTLYQFKNYYCVMGGFGGHEVVGYKNLDVLQKKLSDVMLRRRKFDVLDLPPKIRSTEYIELTPKQKQLYKEVKMGIEANLAEIKLSPNPLTALIRLRQVTGCPEIISDTITDSAKIDRLVEIVEEIVANGQKAIVFSEWTEVTKRVRIALKKFNPAYVTGEGDIDVEDEKARFTNDPDCGVIIGTRPKLGTGHTLTAASTVIFMDKPWNRALEEQAEDRAHRIGTKGTVNIISLVALDTIDEKIEWILNSKADLADAIVDGDIDKMNRLNLLEHLLS